jgi:hypothetical protein
MGRVMCGKMDLCHARKLANCDSPNKLPFEDVCWPGVSAGCRFCPHYHSLVVDGLLA